jgi:sulfatase maturation enzyme AslB (radical SAM superfamily)
MKGEWHPECERCRQEEINGIRSRREYESEDWGLKKTDIVAVTEEDGTLDVEKQNIDFFDIRYGNFCNLKCRMCGPTDSHMWYDDFVKIHGKTSYKDTHETIQLVKNKKGKWHTDQYDWFQGNDGYWHNFEKYAPTAKKLYIVGGEPLIIAEHQESLERLVASGNASEIQLEYNTNLTMVPDRLVYLWEQFKQIRIGVSIDGIDDVFNYQRTPAKFPAVYKHMKTLQDNKKINLKAWFAYTITPMNVYHMPVFMKWKLEESGLDKFNSLDCPRPTITQHLCHSPKYYNIKVLPQKNKDEVVALYQTYKDWVNGTDYSDHVKKHFCSVLDSTARFMMSEDYSEEWLGEFVKITKKLGEARDQNILDIVPQYKDLFCT